MSAEKEKVTDTPPAGRIAIYGVGGIGGLLAGPLLQTYGEAVSLIVRGARKEHLQAQGLTLHSDLFGSYTVWPQTVTDDPDTLPPQDWVLVCVKNGDLPAILPSLGAIVQEQTVVVPVMNGISAGETLRAGLSRGIVCDSVIYTVSGAEKDFSIRQIGSFTKLFVGSMAQEEAVMEAAQRFSTLLTNAGISCRYREDAREEIWKKFILNCAYNVVTAAHRTTTGAIADNAEWRADYRSLLYEAWQVSRAEGVQLEEEVVDHFFALLPTYAPESESSLSRDFAAGREGEMRIFSEEVCHRAAAHGVEVPVTTRYALLLRETLEAQQKERSSAPTSI